MDDTFSLPVLYLRSDRVHSSPVISTLLDEPYILPETTRFLNGGPKTLTTPRHRDVGYNVRAWWLGAYMLRLLFCTFSTLQDAGVSSLTLICPEWPLDIYSRHPVMRLHIPLILLLYPYPTLTC
jgi:hypothetical protein